MSVVSKLEAVLTLNNKQFLSGLKSSQKAIDKFNKSISSLGGKSTGLGAVSKQLATVQKQLTQGFSVKSQKGLVSTTQQTQALSNNIQSLNNSLPRLSSSLRNAFAFKGVTGGDLGGLSTLLKANIGLQIADRFKSLGRSITSTLRKVSDASKESARNMSNFAVSLSRVIRGSKGGNLSKGIGGQMSFDFGFDKAYLKEQFSVLTAGAKSVGVAIAGWAVAAAAAYTALNIVGAQIAKIGIKIKNAERAFKRFAEPGFIKDLRRATGGMIDDLELMHNAIRAIDLGIKKEELPKYFEFAAIKAAETGAEVGRLVDQLVIGIGRKSTQRLDDLGLSLVEIQKEVKKTGNFVEAVGNIIDRKMKQMNITVQETTNGWDQLGVAMTGIWHSFAASPFWDQFNQRAEATALVLKAIFNLNRDIANQNSFYDNPANQPIPQFGKQGPFIGNLNKALKIYQDLAKEAVDLQDYVKWQKAADSLQTYITGLTQVETKVKKISSAIVKLVPNFFGRGGLIPEKESEISLLEQKLKTLKDEVLIQQTLFDIELKRAELKELTTLKEADIKGYSDDIKELGDNMIELGSIVENVAGAAFAAFANTLIDVFEGKNILDAFKDFITQMGRMMATYGALLLAQGIAQKAFEHGEAYTKIVAGAAMLALGLAVAGAGSAINASGSSGGTSSGGRGRTATYSGGLGYDYNREIVLVARGEDLVAVINRVNYSNTVN